MNRLVLNLPGSLENTITEQELLSKIKELNNDETLDGYIIQPITQTYR